MSKNNHDAGVKHMPCWTSGEVPAQYPWMSEDQYCEVCVVGGGITGALCALSIAEKGRSVVLITANEIGFGATSHSSAAAEADTGRTLTDLNRVMDADSALDLYDMGSEALDELENLCNSLDSAEGKCGFRCNFKRRDSLLYTDDESELELLNHEYLARKHNGFECTYITRETARDSFSFDMCGGVLTKGFGGNFNPYNFTHLCLMRAASLGAKIFEHTLASEIETPQNGGEGVKITTSAHRTIHADKLVLATGSDGLESLLPSCRSRTVYSAVSRVIPPENESGWPGKCIIRTFGVPYITYSFTPGGRIAAVGLESRVLGSGGKIGSLLTIPAAEAKKFAHLEDSVRYLFPAMASVRTEFTHECQYLTAPDGLPIIGEHPDYPDCIFALCTGKNTAIFAQLAARLAADITESLYSEDLNLFTPTRFVRSRKKADL